MKKYIIYKLSSFFLFLVASCVFSEDTWFKQHNSRIEQVRKDNNLSLDELIFSNDCLYIFKKTSKINLSSYFKDSCDSLKFHYYGPVFDAKLLSEKNIKYLKITNTSTVSFDFSCLSGMMEIDYLFLTNVKKKELLSIQATSIPVMVLYGDELFEYSSKSFFDIVQKTRTLAFSNIMIVKDSNTFTLPLSSLRFVGNYPFGFSDAYQTPNLNVLELHNVRLDSRTIKHILENYHNVSLRISSCEIDSMDLLKVLQTGIKKLSINQSVLHVSNGYQYIYELTNLGKAD